MNQDKHASEMKNKASQRCQLIWKAHEYDSDPKQSTELFLGWPTQSNFPTAPPTQTKKLTIITTTQRCHEIFCFVYSLVKIRFDSFIPYTLVTTKPIRR